MSDPRRVTLQDVADVAGVSAKTVSRVVNGEPYVAPATAAHVKDVVRRLGFRPDHAARSLARRQRLHLAGLIITSLTNPHVVVLADGVERVLRGAGYSLVIASADEDPDVERRLVAEFQDRGLDSLIVVPSGADDEHEHLVEASSTAALVMVHRVIEGVHADSVSPDDYGATRAAIGRLLAAGHRRVAFVGDQEHIYNTRQRYAGFRQAHEDAGVAVDLDMVVFGSRSSESATSTAHELITFANPPTAIFAANDVNCLGVLIAMQSIDEPLEVVGFDNVALAGHLGVPATLLTYDQSEMGSRAAQLLVSRVEHGGGEPRHVTVPVTAHRVGAPITESAQLRL